MISLDMLYFDLVDLADKQEKIIKHQSEIITKLLNENVEKENMINALMEDIFC